MITKLESAVLHVSYKNVFDLFLFSRFVCVWWGMDRGAIGIVEDDFLTGSYLTRAAIIDRHAAHEISELYPVWCSYEIADYSIVTAVQRAEAIAHYEEKLLFDHFSLPRDSATEVMTAISFALLTAAKVDYLELVTENVRSASMNICMTPDQVPLLYDNRALRKLAGEVRMYEMLAADIGTQPEWFWERSYLQPYYEMAMAQYTVSLRSTWFKARCDALDELLETGDSHHHRMFMIKSDWILIVILVADISIMLIRLFITLYFLEPTA